MVLVIGGAYQGKCSFAKEHYGLPVIAAEGYARGIPAGPAILDSFHLFARRLIDSGRSFLGFLEENKGLLQDKVVLCDDIFCGVVPVDASERLWREELGRAMIRLSAEADEVFRVFCGLATKLK